MHKNLETYVKVYKQHIDPVFCQQVVSELEDANFQIHTFYTAETKSSQSYAKELSVSFENVTGYTDLHTMTWGGIRKYLSDLDFEWFSAWSGFSSIRFNQYQSGTQMKEHCDHIQTIFDGDRKGIPILSIVGVLNEDYEGGEFIMWQDCDIKLKTGDLLIFPSNFLYPHRVNEVTKGTRNTFVSWVW